MRASLRWGIVSISILLAIIASFAAQDKSVPIGLYVLLGLDVVWLLLQMWLWRLRVFKP